MGGIGPICSRRTAVARWERPIEEKAKRLWRKSVRPVTPSSRMGKCKDTAACRPWKVQQVTSSAVGGGCSFGVRESRRMLKGSPSGILASFSSLTYRSEAVKKPLGEKCSLGKYS